MLEKLNLLLLLLLSPMTVAALATVSVIQRAIVTVRMATMASLAPSPTQTISLFLPKSLLKSMILLLRLDLYLIGIF